MPDIGDTGTHVNSEIPIGDPLAESHPTLAKYHVLSTGRSIYLCWPKIAIEIDVPLIRSCPADAALLSEKCSSMISTMK